MKNIIKSTALALILGLSCSVTKASFFDDLFGEGAPSGRMPSMGVEGEAPLGMLMMLDMLKKLHASHVSEENQALLNQYAPQSLGDMKTLEMPIERDENGKIISYTTFKSSGSMLTKKVQVFQTETREAEQWHFPLVDGSTLTHYRFKFFDGTKIFPAYALVTPSGMRSTAFGGDEALRVGPFRLKASETDLSDIARILFSLKYINSSTVPESIVGSVLLTMNTKLSYKVDAVESIQGEKFEVKEKHKGTSYVDLEPLPAQPDVRSEDSDSELESDLGLGDLFSQ